MMRSLQIKTVAALCTAVLLTTVAQAQTVDIRFTTSINVGAGTAGVDQLEVVVEADTDIDFDIGNSDFIFFFNDSALDLAGGANGPNQDLVENTDYVFHSPYVAPFYNTNKVVMQNPINRLGGLLRLGLANFGSPVAAASGWVPLFTVYFDIADDQSTEMLTWVGAPDPNPSVVFKEDNSTPVTIGMMINSDLPLDASAAVELAGLQSTVDNGALSLSWSTASESGNAGFAVEVTRANEEMWREVGYVPGSGTSNEIRSYTYDVTGLDYGSWRVRLKQVDINGSWTYSAEIKVAIELAEEFVLGDVYPSPFSSTARFTLAVGEPQAVKIDAYNLLGQKVLTIFEGDMAASQTRSFELDGSTLPNGIYLIRAAGASFATTTSVALLK